MVGPDGSGPREQLRAEIVSVGTELLLGTIVDTNAAYLGQRLAELGIDCFYVSAVGDNLGRLTETFSRAFRRSNLVVCTGGLGPTSDDLTREAVGATLGETASVVPELEANVRSFFARRGVDMPAQNLKQATLIPSARAIGNPIGTAPGWWVTAQVEGAIRTGIFMPGVPFEMKRMWEHEVEPQLRGRTGMVLVSRTLKTLGAGESAIEKMVVDLMDGSNPTLAPYAKSDGVHLRITAKATTPGEAAVMIARLEAEVRKRLGDLVYGADTETPQGSVAGLAAWLGVNYSIIEIGLGAIGSVAPALAGTSGFRGEVAVANRVEGEALLGTGTGVGLLGLCEAMASRTAADVVLVVQSDVAEVNGDATVVRAEVEARLYRRDGETLARQRQTWQIAPGEVQRVVGLLALNLLRGVLLKLTREKEREIAGA